MKKFLIGAMVLAAATATPAMAQRYGGYNGGNYDARADQLDDQIEQARSQGYLDGREYSQLRQNQSVLHARIDQYSRGGISPWERNEIEDRISKQRYNIDLMIREDSRRGYRDYRGNNGYGNGYNRGRRW